MNELDLVRDLTIDTPHPRPIDLAGARARLTAAIEAASAPAAERRRLRARGRRPVARSMWPSAIAAGLAAGLAAAIAVVIAVTGVPGSGPVATAQAFPVFATPTISEHEIANSILGSYLKSKGLVLGSHPLGSHPHPPTRNAPYYTQAVRHAHAFRTHWGTAYTFAKHDATNGYSVCAIYPDYQTKVIPWHGGWTGGCGTGPTLARAVRGWETIEDPRGIEFVQLVPADTTAVLTLGRGRAQPVAIRNGVLDVYVTTSASLVVRHGDQRTVHRLAPGISAPPRPPAAARGLAGRPSHPR